MCPKRADSREAFCRTAAVDSDSSIVQGKTSVSKEGKSYVLVEHVIFARDFDFRDVTRSSQTFHEVNINSVLLIRKMKLKEISNFPWQVVECWSSCLRLAPRIELWLCPVPWDVCEGRQVREHA